MTRLFTIPIYEQFLYPWPRIAKTRVYYKVSSCAEPGVIMNVPGKDGIKTCCYYGGFYRVLVRDGSKSEVETVLHGNVEVGYVPNAVVHPIELRRL